MSQLKTLKGYTPWKHYKIGPDERWEGESGPPSIPPFYFCSPRLPQTRSLLERVCEREAEVESLPCEVANSVQLM